MKSMSITNEDVLIIQTLKTQISNMENIENSKREVTRFAKGGN